MPTVPSPFRPGALRRASGVPWIPEVDRSSALIDYAAYRGGHRQPAQKSWQEAYDSVVATGDGFVWIGLHEPSERQLSAFAERFGLHPLAVEDAVHAHQRPKLERYDDMLFAVVKTVHYDDTLPAGKAELVETGEIMVFLGADYVLTVRHGSHGGLRRVRRRLEQDAALLALGPATILHAVLDAAVDDYLTVASALQEDIDEIEVAVFSGPRATADTNRMYVMKREVLALRRSTAPLSVPLKGLASQNVPFVPEDLQEYFRDIDDHLSQVTEQVTSFDDMLNTLVSANLAQVSVTQNEDMRRISAWVAIAAVPTMVAGIYGMNFEHMPELHWEFGYPIVIGAILLVCIGLYRNFRRNGWL